MGCESEHEMWQKCQRFLGLALSPISYVLTSSVMFVIVYISWKGVSETIQKNGEPTY